MSSEQPAQSDNSSLDLVTMGSDGTLYLAPRLRDLADAYVKQRVSEIVQSDVERRVDVRWEERLAKLKIWLTVASVIGIGTAFLGIVHMVQAEIERQTRSQVAPVVAKAIADQKKRLDEATSAATTATATATARATEAEKAASDAGIAAHTASNQAQTTSNAAETARLLVETMDKARQNAASRGEKNEQILNNIVATYSDKVKSLTEGLETLFNRFPHETGALKEQLGLPVGTIILVPSENLNAFLNGHLEWIEPADSKVFNAADAKWTLADKRFVPKSAYSRDLGYPQVPDGSTLAASESKIDSIGKDRLKSTDTDAKKAVRVLVKINY